METLPATPLLNFPDDTLNVIRKSYNLDKPGAMDQAIDILELWLKKQDHFITKDFSRDYLERLIIRCKGSIERAKERLDNSCTARTMLPEFCSESIMVDPLPDYLLHGMLPTLTKDYYRVYFLVNNGQTFTTDGYLNYYLRALQVVEYAAAHDYSQGFVFIADYRNVNLMELIKTADMSLTAKYFNLTLKSFGMRIKAIHIISNSKALNAFLSLVKQIIPEKTSSRIVVHSEIDTLYEHVEKDILPKDFGGNEKSCKELDKMWFDAVTSEEHVNYMKKINAAKTDESLRMKDNKYKQPDLGIPGTFRNISVD